MKRCVIILLLLAFPVLAYSDDSNKRQSIEELLTLTNADSMIDAMYGQMDQMTKGMAQQLGIKPSEEELFNRYMSKMFSAMREEVSWEKMKAPMIELYMKHYSEKEIKDMVVFYKSETGRSMMKKMPEVMKDSMQISQSMMQGFVPKMQAILAEVEKELAAERGKQ